MDRKIIAELQSDGRLSITELAERVNLSLSPCHRRLRALEQEGVITGYRANLDPLKMGFNFLAIVFATLKEGDKKAVSAFEEAVEEIPQIVLAQRLVGDPLAVAQDGYFIAQLENLFHFVRDIDDTAAAIFQLADDLEQMVDLFLRQR